MLDTKKQSMGECLCHGRIRLCKNITAKRLLFEGFVDLSL